jgi:hypothetical protein
MITFKEFVTVVEELQNEKGGVGQAGPTSIDEVLSFLGRRKRAINMKRRSQRLKTSRKIALRKTADITKLQQRARKSARDILVKKYFGGKSKSQMTVSQKARAEKRLDKAKGAVIKISKKLIPVKRALDIGRR